MQYGTVSIRSGSMVRTLDVFHVGRYLMMILQCYGGGKSKHNTNIHIEIVARSTKSLWFKWRAFVKSERSKSMSRETSLIKKIVALNENDTEHDEYELTILCEIADLLAFIADKLEEQEHE